MNLPFGGLNHTEIANLIYYPLDKVSPLQLNKKLDDAAVKDVQFITFCQQFLKDVQTEKKVRLTTKGNLNRKFVHQLYNHRIYTSSYIDEGKIKLLSEEDFMPIHLAHMITKMAGLVKKYQNKLSLTKKGEKIVNSPGQIYLALLKAYTSKFNWTYMSYLEDDIGQLGWAFIMYLFLLYGDENRSIQFYEEQYLAILPETMNKIPVGPHINSKERYSSNFEGKFFNRFCHYFALAESTTEKGKYGISKTIGVKKTPLTDLVFTRVAPSRVGVYIIKQ